MIPGEALSTTAAPAAFLSPDDIKRNPRTTDYELGGAGIGDGSQGLQVQSWRVRVSGTDVLVSADPYTSETLVFSEAGITECSLAFDQNMNYVIAYVANGIAKLRWYDPIADATVKTNFAADVRSPFVCMDDKLDRATTLNRNDVLLFYIRGSSLYYRQQRDRYDTEYLLKTFPGPAVTIRRVGMSVANRIQIELVGQDAQ